jgi:hypothetical protein
MKNFILKIYWKMFLRAAQDQKNVKLARLAKIKLVKLN